MRNATIQTRYDLFEPRRATGTEATVRIFLEGELTGSYEQPDLARTDAFWMIGRVGWPSKNIYVRDEVHDHPPG